MAKSPDAFRTISEVADWLGVQAHVLRFWESKFSHVKPVKRAGGRRYYRPSDMLLLGGIKKLLHDDGMTIKGVQKIIREQGVGYVSDQSASLDDLTMAQLDTEADRAEKPAAKPDAAAPPAQDSGTVVPFHSPTETAPDVAPDGTPPEEAAPPSEEPAAAADEVSDEGPESGAEEDPQTPPAAPQEPAAHAPAPPAQHEQLPSFMQKPQADKAAPPDGPKPRVVEADDGPDEQDISVTPGVLARAAALHRLRPADLTAARESYARLDALQSRMTGTSKE